MIYANYQGKIIKAERSLPRLKVGYRCRYEFCSDPDLILKKGPVKIPHFAHRSRTECEQYAEPETDAHRAMKEFLQQFLQIPDRYMEYGKIRGVRPDLVWKNQFAIEVQHSHISIDEVKRRNQIYFNAGLVPLWIFHEQEIENCNYYERNRGIYGRYHWSEAALTCVEDIPLHTDLFLTLKLVEKYIYTQ